MEQLNIILFVSGFAIAIIAVTIMLIKYMKGKGISYVAIFLVIIGFVTLGAGFWVTNEQNNSSNTTVAKSTNSKGTTTANPTTTTKEANTSTVANTSKEVAFDPTGSAVPTSSMDTWGNVTYLDADGSKAYGGLLFTPDGIRYHVSTEGAIVGISDGKTYADGKHYKEYAYSNTNSGGIIYVVESNFSTKDETHADQNKDLGTGKVEQYPPNSGYDMKYIDFIYKYIPVSKPKSTIKNNFLSGIYAGKEDKILDAKTTMSIKIIDDKLLDFKCSYIAGMDSLYGYKIESLGKNAYKLYLYTARVKADTNGGGVTISDEPLKRTFLIYMKSKDSFDIVFTSDDIKRTSINMNKQ